MHFDQFDGQQVYIAHVDKFVIEAPAADDATTTGPRRSGGPVERTIDDDALMRAFRSLHEGDQA